MVLRKVPAKIDPAYSRAPKALTRVLYLFLFAKKFPGDHHPNIGKSQYEASSATELMAEE